MKVKFRLTAAAMACHLFLALLLALLTSSTFVSAAQAQQVSRQIAQRFNHLPPTELDSFVHQAGSRGEAIYGDEGIRTPPPYFGFDQSHRIDSGIMGQRDAGITTGHGSILPSAWGWAPYEECKSGPKSNQYTGTLDNDYDYSREINAYENSLEGLQNRINSINDRLEELRYALTTISPADISGRQDINREIADLENARFDKIVKIQALEEKMRTHFGVH
ncbi:hypothetical protein BH11CYA1_BH11CYA1_01150 [soil metagenome]